MAKERIGLVGPGRIGLAMVEHLVRNGYPVTVTDIDLKKLCQVMLISTGKSVALEQWNTMSFTWALKDMQIVQRLMDKANLGSPLIGTVRGMVKEGRKLKANGDVPDWTALATGLS